MSEYDKILYHFTSDHHINGCLRKGLIRGVTFWGTTGISYHFLKNTQWLTSNPDFNQSWNELSTLPYDRTANRLKICIPKEFTQNISCWKLFSQRLPLSICKLLSAYGDPENWYVYEGIIPPEWIIERVKKNQIKVGENL